MFVSGETRLCARPHFPTRPSRPLHGLGMIGAASKRDLISILSASALFALQLPRRLFHAGRFSRHQASACWRRVLRSFGGERSFQCLSPEMQTLCTRALETNTKFKFGLMLQGVRAKFKLRNSRVLQLGQCVLCSSVPLVIRSASTWSIVVRVNAQWS